MWSSRFASVAMCAALVSPMALAQKPDLSPDAPEDKPGSVAAEQEAEFLAALEPYVKKAKKTYPGAKGRFLEGLPADEIFFVTTRLADDQGRLEQVFIRVSSIRAETIRGTIASNILGVSGFNFGDPYEFSESDLVDWLIAKPDGSQEGNFVGKFLDEYQNQPDAGVERPSN